MNDVSGVAAEAAGLLPTVEPVPVSPPDGAAIPNAVTTIILRKLDREQRAFILRMKPHRRDQRITKADFDNIEPCVDAAPNDFPDVYWFGGMRANWLPGAPRCIRTFRFNEVGIEVRDAIASAMSARSGETSGLAPQDASAVGKAETPNPNQDPSHV